VSRVGREVQWQVLKKEKGKVSKDFKNPLGREETFIKEKCFIK